MLTGTSAESTSEIGNKWDASVTVITVAPKPAIVSTAKAKSTMSASAITLRWLGLYRTARGGLGAAP